MTIMIRKKVLGIGVKMVDGDNVYVEDIRRIRRDIDKVKGRKIQRCTRNISSYNIYG